ncbi:hypothetical protein FFF34_000860 [Inquilinus sp. KBS0705]|nr:hypothetical protein FFF34_000860 [Inquilinus sp. KBS0705]
MMDSGAIGLVLIILICVSVLIGLPILLVFLFYRWLAKKGYKTVGLIIFVGFVFFIAYNIFTAFFPNDSFFYNEFQKVTSKKIPLSANIIAKTASYPDFHGDYASCSLIKLSKADYLQLLNSCINDKALSTNDQLIGSEELDTVMKNRKVEDIKTAFGQKVNVGDHYTYLGFFKDQETILVYFINP